MQYKAPPGLKVLPPCVRQLVAQASVGAVAVAASLSAQQHQQHQQPPSEAASTGSESAASVPRSSSARPELRAAALRARLAAEPPADPTQWGNYWPNWPNWNNWNNWGNWGNWGNWYNY